MQLTENELCTRVSSKSSTKQNFPAFDLAVGFISGSTAGVLADPDL